MPATFKFFTYKNRTDANGEAAIYLRITYNRKKKYYNTGERIEPDYLRGHNSSYRYWIKKSYANDRINGKKLRIDLEDRLAEIFDTAKVAARNLERMGTCSAEAIKQRIIGASQDNFFTFADEYKEDLKHYTRKNTVATLNKLEEYLGERVLLFSDITSTFLNKFKEELLKENKKSTVRKNMGDLRRLIEAAKDDKLIFGDPFDDVDPISSGDAGYKVKLPYEKIQKMEQLDLEEGSNLWHARNSFVLSFYLGGMRFGDLAMLKWKNVEGGVLNYKMGKTEREVKMNIKPQAGRFLDYYTPGEPENFILPFLADLTKEERKDPQELRKKVGTWNAVVNKHLKTIQGKIGVTENLTTHCARHSFAWYGIKKGLSPHKMMMLLGHKSITTTEKYLKKIDDNIVNESLDVMFD